METTLECVSHGSPCEQRAVIEPRLRQQARTRLSRVAFPAGLGTPLAAVRAHCAQTRPVGPVVLPSSSWVPVWGTRGPKRASHESWVAVHLPSVLVMWEAGPARVWEKSWSQESVRTVVGLPIPARSPPQPGADWKGAGPRQAGGELGQCRLEGRTAGGCPSRRGGLRASGLGQVQARCAPKGRGAQIVHTGA